MKPSQPPKSKRRKKLIRDEVKEAVKTASDALNAAPDAQQAGTVPTSQHRHHQQQLPHHAAATVPPHPYMTYPCYPPHPNNPNMMTMTTAPFAHAFPYHPHQQQHQHQQGQAVTNVDDPASSSTEQQQDATANTTTANNSVGGADESSSTKTTPQQQQTATTAGTTTANNSVGGADASSTNTTSQQQAATTTGTTTTAATAGADGADASSTTPPSAEQLTAEQLASSGIPWYSPETLERSLKDREGRGNAGLNSTESRILGLLVTHQASANRRKEGQFADGRVASVTIPGRRGCPPQTYIRHPVKRMVRRKPQSVREIADLVREVCDRCDVDRREVVRLLGKEEADRRPEEEKTSEKQLMIKQSITLMKEAQLSDRKYHEIRMFIAKIWGIKVGVPLHVINDYRKENPSIPEVSIIQAQFASKRTKIIDRKRPRKRIEAENEG